MKLILITLLFFTSTGLMAGGLLTCRDRGNFMSSWYKLVIKKDFFKIEGSLIFQTSEGARELTRFNLPLKEIANTRLKYADKTSSLSITSLKSYDALEFKTSALERPFTEGFKCQKTSSLIERSFWNTPMASDIFYRLDSPLLFNNGGFREIRRAKKFELKGLNIVLDELAHNTYSFNLKIDPAGRLHSLRSVGRKIIISFNREESNTIKDAFKELFNDQGILKIKEIKTIISCLDQCQMALN